MHTLSFGTLTPGLWKKGPWSALPPPLSNGGRLRPLSLSILVCSSMVTGGWRRSSCANGIRSLSNTGAAGKIRPCSGCSRPAVGKDGTPLSRLPLYGNLPVATRCLRLGWPAFWEETRAGLQGALAFLKPSRKKSLRRSEPEGFQVGPPPACLHRWRAPTPIMQRRLDNG